MWPFTTSKHRSQHDAQLRRDLDQLRDDFDALRAQHLSLRGRVYALWGKEKGSGDGVTGASPSGDGSHTAPAPQRLSKDELRRIAGIKPGKPYPHPGEDNGPI